MDQCSKLIQALSSFLWPVICLILFWRFRESVSQILESAKGRKFTVKVGGQELTMDEASSQQEHQINELRKQITAIQQILNITTTQLDASISGSHEPEIKSNAILWVDDHPKNNSYLISAIKDGGCEVDLALSTEDGLQRVEQNKYRLIVSDMGRTENGEYVKDAGLRLLNKLRESKNQTPFIVFCSASGARKYKESVIASGGISATSSSSVLFSLMRDFLPSREA